MCDSLCQLKMDLFVKVLEHNLLDGLCTFYLHWQYLEIVGNKTRNVLDGEN